MCSETRILLYSTQTQNNTENHLKIFYFPAFWLLLLYINIFLFLLFFYLSSLLYKWCNLDNIVITTANVWWVLWCCCLMCFFVSMQFKIMKIITRKSFSFHTSLVLLNRSWIHSMPFAIRSETMPFVWAIWRTRRKWEKSCCKSDRT